MANALHIDEIQIGVELVRKLVDSEFPQYANLPLKRLDALGSTSVLYFLGDDLIVRLPRLPGGGASIAKECRWTQLVGNHLPVAVPEVVAVGEPAFGYSELWSIVRWQSGEHPETCSPEDLPRPERLQLAIELAEILIAFRSIEISLDARSDRQLRDHYRGRPLAEHDIRMRQNIEACRSIEALELDLDGALVIWERALDLPGASEVHVDGHRWFHGDIVAENLLVRRGRLTGLLDFGGLGLGDPTVDLHGAWELFDAPARKEFRKRSGVDDAEWLRGRAWALAIALMTFPYYWNTMPGRIGNRLAMARSVLADPE